MSLISLIVRQRIGMNHWRCSAAASPAPLPVELSAQSVLAPQTLRAERLEMTIRTTARLYCGHHTSSQHVRPVPSVSDRARHFSNRCDVYEVAKVVHGNRSDNQCSRSDN